jgi:hypothetical protein
MKSVLLGNGINIQFGGKAYYNYGRIINFYIHNRGDPIEFHCHRL